MDAGITDGRCHYFRLVRNHHGANIVAAGRNRRTGLTLPGNSLLVAHRNCDSVAHGPCATEFTPLKFEFCGAPARAPQKSPNLWRTANHAPQNLFFSFKKKCGHRELPCAAGHERGPVPRALLAAGDAHPEVEQAAGGGGVEGLERKLAERWGKTVCARAAIEIYSKSK